MARIIFFMTVLCSMFSQHPMFIGTSVAIILKYSWALPFMYLVITHSKTKLHRVIKTYFGFSIFFVIYDLLFASKDQISLKTDVINILMSFLVLYTSFLFWIHNKSEKFLRYLCIALLLSITYLAFIIYTSFLSTDTLNEVQYAYSSKNSIATIILSTIIICSLNIKPNWKVFSYFLYACYFILIVIMFLLKSRATLVGFIYFISYISTRYNNKKIRYTIALALIVCVGYILYNPDAYEIVVNNIFFANRAVNDFNAVSSGRDEQFAQFWDDYVKSPLFGIGRGYVDSFPLEILIKYGIIGLFVMSLFIFKIYKQIYNLPRNSSLHLTTFLLLCVFLLNSLFEAYPPFGPGIKCCLLWMFVGFSFADKSQQKNIIK